MLVRQIEQLQRWARAFDAEPGARTLAPAMLHDVLEPDGKPSFWRLSDVDVELPRLAVAYCSTKGRFPKSKYSVVVVNEDLVIGSGLQLDPEKGLTADIGVNCLHVNVLTPSIDSAITLGTIMMNHGTVRNITRQQLVRDLAAAVASGNISPTSDCFKLAETDITNIVMSSLHLSLRWIGAEQ